MAYIGNNPKLKSIVSSGDTLANLTAEPRKAGRLAYATDEGQFVYDNGTELLAVGNCPNGVDSKAALDALPRKVGNIYYATDDELLYMDNGTILVAVGGGFPLMAAGSLITSNGISNGEFAIGTDGQVLTVDTTVPDNTKLKWALPASSGSPVGTISAFGGTTAPTGYLICDGSLVDRTLYADLFAAIGTNFGAGDGSTTFAIPDMRGRFLRGRANGSGLDPDRASRTAQSSGGATGDNVGSVQSDQYFNHTHSGPSHNHEIGIRAGSGAYYYAGASFISVVNQYSYLPVAGDISGSGSYQAWRGFTSTISGTTGGAGGNETRPENIYVNYIIKY